MLGITPFGLFHTLISLVSLFTGLYALLRFGRILDRQHSGQVYIWGTVGSCVTGFFIVRHGGFSQAHALGIATLLALAAGWWLGRNAKPGSLKQIASTLAYTLTVFFHFIPGVNETLVRVPVGKGTAVVMGIRPHWRGQPHNTFKLLFNPLFLSTAGR